jgi:hypothetical protein
MATAFSGCLGFLFEPLRRSADQRRDRGGGWVRTTLRRAKLVATVKEGFRRA